MDTAKIWPGFRSEPLLILMKLLAWAALWMGAASAWNRRSRAFWLLGGVCLGVHVALAFHEVHGWSHAAAWEATALQVERVTGWRSGSGLPLTQPR